VSGPRRRIPAGFEALSAYTAKPDPAPIKLDANESPWPLPDALRRRLAERMGELEWHRYPDGGARRAKAALAARLGADPDELVLGVGSDELLSILFRAFSRPPARVLYPTPTFVMIPLSARVQGFETTEVPLDPDRWTLDVEALLDASIDPSIVYLATPNNPTGVSIPDADLQRIVEAHPESFVLIDEAYGPFARHTVGEWVRRYPQVGVLGTLSKVGLAGLRFGWVRLPPDLAHEVEKARPPYNLNLATQAAAELLLTEGAEALDAQVDAIVQARDALAPRLSDLGLAVTPSDANFLWVRTPGPAQPLQAALLERGVQVRRFGVPALDHHLRITVGTPEENDALCAALEAITR
jgi:histidinol-phosphate aminotransferase